MAIPGGKLYTYISYIDHAVANPGGDPRVPRIPPFSLAIMALVQLPVSYLSVFVAIVV